MSKWSSEQLLSEFYAEGGERLAVLSQDKYHYICRLWNIKGGIKHEYDTVLFHDKSQAYCEDLCENFVNYIGPFNIR